MGWRLSPMFDVNPNPYGGEGALDKGDLLGDAGYYRFTPAQAKARYDQIAEIVRKEMAEVKPKSSRERRAAKKGK